MKYKIKDVTIADGIGLFIEKGEILIDNGKIAEIGEKVSDCNTIYNARGRLLLPGMTNPHHHLYSALATGLAPKGPTPDFVKILENLWWHLDAILDEDMVYASAMAGIMDSIKAGVTTVFDHHASMSYVRGSLETMAQAFTVTGVRGLLCFESSDRTGEKETEEHIRENVDFYEKHINDTMIKGAFGLHANMTLCERSMEKIRDAKPKDMAIHAHVAEDKADLEYCRNLGYMGALDRLEKFHLIDENSLVIHAIHLADGEYDILGRTKPIVVNNAESNANNGVGSMDRDKIGNFVLGTDGMTGDMIGSLRSHFLLGSLPGGFAGLSDRFFRQTYRAQQMFFPEITGLKEGAPADIAVLDYSPKTPINADNLLGHLIFGAQKGNAWMTIADGRILWHEGHFTQIDEDEIFKDIQSNAQRLHTKFNKG